MFENEQKRIVIDKFVSWSGNNEIADFWYCNGCIASLGMTPEEAVDAGYYKEVIAYLRINGLGSS
ncbi:hypothetical protein N9L48_06165 [Psychrosphaera sp.]|nr:hypothetical protein [Psychrosphaera sp.]